MHIVNCLEYVLLGIFVLELGSVVQCEFEADQDDDKEASLTSSVIMPSDNLIRIYYVISSPDVHIQLTLEAESTHEVLQRHLLLNDVESFDYRNDIIDRPYVMVIRAIRVCVPRCNTNAAVLLLNVNVQETIERGQQHRNIALDRRLASLLRHRTSVKC